jgi:peptidoglycan/xylan/chitin deacetylase (PgdA/CDA1 family)
MLQQVSIVMYHYVRELPYSRYPDIKGLLYTDFKEQLAYMKKHYEFVTIDDCVNAVYSKGILPKNAILLTFDDAYIDHYVNVFPILDEYKIQGCFFPPAKAILNNEVLDVNKIHFIIASTNINKIIADIYNLLDQFKDDYGLQSKEYYYEKLARPSRFDVKEVIFVKRLLQSELEYEVRKIFVDKLFKKYVTSDENAFSQELYMSLDQMKCMVRNGMYIGAHGYDHFWLDTLSTYQQEKEVDLSIEFLKRIHAPIDKWVMCYPYGAYNQSLIEILKRKNCVLGLTTEVDIAQMVDENAFSLPRLDTNDLPKSINQEPNEWTCRVI